MGQNSDEANLDVAERMEELWSLKDNWDSYDSPPPSKELCLQVMKSLEESEAMSPYIYPVPGGDVQCEWVIDSRELEIEFSMDVARYYLLDLETDEDEEGEFDYRKNPKKIQELIQWLYKNRSD